MCIIFLEHCPSKLCVCLCCVYDIHLSHIQPEKTKTEKKGEVKMKILIDNPKTVDPFDKQRKKCLKKKIYDDYTQQATEKKN